MKRLDLDRNWIGDDGAFALAYGLGTNQHLETLDLRGNKIGCQGAAALANFL
eukprot:CAMPEP_0118700348 /NCGR_PEP_ID=MMETSP0800-20121206/16521_1 /TAXON_ID=210618 ORGANISM="Striatella unipunctata, Strain CCMP2910" /NCGR_SAMPLE_ID=MMETSP0800 /ASSEMBLY_ACC=CAM_ASM_000638 /LENGTH=51 /DNA_ID=CAMNT_0006600899 /DNA_START=23 /DNA_END=174 /DNA_ORIENTATION=+